jgi:hypothetical protein
MGFTPETKPRTSIMYVIHQADLLAARIEFEKEWLPKLLGPRENTSKEPKTNNFSLNKNTSATKQKALKKMANPALAELMKNI